MQGVQHVVEFRCIGVNVLKAYVGGSHGHCWVELRYLLRHLLYAVSTCRWVKARSDWFVSSWSKRHMLAREDLRDSDKQALQICPTTAHDANSRIFGVDAFRLDFSVVLGLSWKRCSTVQGGCNVGWAIRCVDW